jgi:hypothetical protein
VAFATASDALARRNPNERDATKQAPGLRGGTVTFDDANRRILLRDSRFVNGVAVSGEIRLPAQDGIAHANLTTSSGQTLQLSWRPFQAHDIVIVTGTANGRPFITPVSTS